MGHGGPLEADEVLRNARRCRRPPLLHASQATAVIHRTEQRQTTPSSSSKSWTCRLNAGYATGSRAAALVKFRVSRTARKYRRCCSSTAEFHHAEKASQRNKHDIGRKRQTRAH